MLEKTKEYEMKKLYNIISMTQFNCENFIKRLESRMQFSNFVVIYYSIFLIIYSITGKYYSDIYNSTLSEYFSIIISVVILTYSIISGSAKYSERITNMEEVLKLLKITKRELTQNNIEDMKKEYHRIISISERTTDLDFFNTLKQKCRENDINWYNYKEDIRCKHIDENADIDLLEQIGKYLGKVSPIVQQTKIYLNIILSIIVIIMPIKIFSLCIK